MSGALARFVNRREVALGARLALHRDPERAAELLAAALGGKERARAWARRLLEALEALK
jgi:hypothetical protein